MDGRRTSKPSNKSHHTVQLAHPFLMTSVLLDCYGVVFSLAMISAILAPLLRGEEQGSKSPFSLLSEPISPSFRTF